MKSILKIFRIFLAPKGITCPFCGREIEKGRKICSWCLEHLQFVGDKKCIKCGREIFGEDKVCYFCRNAAHSFDKGYVTFTYEGKMKSAILRMKSASDRGLATFLSDLIVSKAEEITETFDLVAYVPMIKREELRRGFNQSRIFAEAVAKAQGKQLFDGTEKIRKTKKQQHLKPKERKSNLDKAFKVTESVAKKRVLVVDDVLTTGATMDEMAKALKKRGAEDVYFLTLAGTTLNK